MGSESGEFWWRTLMFNWFGHQSWFVRPRAPPVNGHLLALLSSVFASMSLSECVLLCSRFVYRDHRSLESDRAHGRNDKRAVYVERLTTGQVRHLEAAIGIEDEGK